MNFRTALLLFLFFSGSLIGQNNLYQIDSIKEVKFYFNQPKWKHLLDSLYINGQKERLTASVSIDGQYYDSVGIRYKGYSSVNITQIKNPFNIKFRFK